MAGRKLSLNQARRVSGRHRRRLERAETPGDSPAGDQHGVVVACFGKKVEVEDADTPQCVVRCHLRANLESVVTGDRVIWRRDGDAGVVLARLDRSSELGRPDARGRARIIAANLDQIVIVIAPEPAPHSSLLDRYLVAAENAGIGALLLLNKTDLGDADGRLEQLLRPYTDIGYPVLRASALKDGGLDELRAALADHTTAFVGQSGVGKSSLISALLPQQAIRIGDLSDAEMKGRHTTTTARLYHLRGGGELIDSPGIREFSLEHLDTASTAAGFVEFRSYLGRCRFRDCEHRDEPGCAVREAVEEGALSAVRYAGYLHIIGARQ